MPTRRERQRSRKVAAQDPFAAAVQKMRDTPDAGRAARGPEAAGDPPSSGPSIGAVSLSKLRAAVERRAAADQKVEALVHECRRVGVPWVRIAGALGVTTEGARKRYRTIEGPPPAALRGEDFE